MIPSNIFFAMRDSGALMPGKDYMSFDVNFAIVAEQFPEYLEHVVCGTLNELERKAYEQGYMAYKVLPNGLLQWHVTSKRLGG